MAVAAFVAAVVVLAKAVHLLLDPSADAIETLVRQALLVALVVAVVWRVVGRERLVRVMGLRVPLRRLAWTVGPAAVVLGGLFGVAALRGLPISLSGWDTARIVVATGLGEELLFRGAVYGLAVRRSRRLAVVVSSVAFGWWHVVDAIQDVTGNLPVGPAVLFVLGTVALMTAVGFVVFAPLRRLAGSAWGPGLLHASWNLGATVAFGHVVVASL